MNWRKIFKWTKITFLIVYGLLVLGLVGSLTILFYLTLADKSAIADSNVINTLSVMMGLVSMPGILMSFFSIVEINEKKKFKATKECPNCRHRIELALEES